jgi:predicted anti-sigma-YlaC factor YlaD
MHACAEALSLLSLSLDEELNPLDSHKLERHLRDCPDCRRKGACFEAIASTLRELPLETPSVSSSPRLPRRRRIARAGIPVAAAMIAASLGLVALQGSTDMGSGVVSPTATVSSARPLSPVTHSLPSQERPEFVSALIVLP